MPSWQRVASFHITSDLRGHANADFSTAHFRKTNRSLSPVGFIGQFAFAFTYFRNGFPIIPVPFQGVHREIKMRVEYEHKINGRSPFGGFKVRPAKGETKGRIFPLRFALQAQCAVFRAEGACKISFRRMELCSTLKKA